MKLKLKLRRKQLNWGKPLKGARNLETIRELRPN